MVVQSKFSAGKKVKDQQKQISTMLNVLEAVRMVSLYVLRNQGYGRKRLLEFNDKFNEYAKDVGNGLFSLEDIAGVLAEETGLSLDDLKLQGLFMS